MQYLDVLLKLVIFESRPEKKIIMLFRVRKCYVLSICSVPGSVTEAFYISHLVVITTMESDCYYFMNKEISGN